MSKQQTDTEERTRRQPDADIAAMAALDRIMCSLTKTDPASVPRVVGWFNAKYGIGARGFDPVRDAPPKNGFNMPREVTDPKEYD